MKPIIKYLIKQFIIGFLLAAIVYHLIGLLFFPGNDSTVIQAVSFALIFNTVMVFIYFSISHYKHMGLNINELTGDQLKHHQILSVKSKMTLEQIKKSINGSSYFDNLEVSIDKNKLSFVQKPKGLSWGERIIITKLKGNKNIYQVESKPLFGFQMYEYGINLRNINEIEKLLS